MMFPILDEPVYDHLIVHASATKPDMDVDSWWIDREHRKRGWKGCGYHVVITRDGEVQWEETGHPTRKIGEPGAHVGGCGPGWNKRSLGVCMIGGLDEHGRPAPTFTDAQYESLRAVIYDAVATLGIPFDNVMGHRDLIKLTGAAPKACPCFSVREWLLNPDGDDDLREKYDNSRLSFNWDRKRFKAERRNDPTWVPKLYTVRKGDTLWKISERYGVPMKTIIHLNKLKDPDNIKVGQKLRLLR